VRDSLADHQGEILGLESGQVNEAKALGELLNVGWRNIPITLINPEKGEQTAHACVMAWFRQLTVTSRSWGILAE